MSDDTAMDKEETRLQRQLRMLTSGHPTAGDAMQALLQDRWRLVRIPLGLALILGGIFAILPVLGLWMLPFGLILLAVDIPALRPWINGLLIRSRRSVRTWRTWWSHRRNS